MIWISVLLVGVPVALLFVGDIVTLTDYATTAVTVLLILSLSVSGWRLKRRLKERMRRGLGRTVTDWQLTSITEWMRIPNEAARAGKDAEKYDFD